MKYLLILLFMTSCVETKSRLGWHVYQCGYLTDCERKLFLNTKEECENALIQFRQLPIGIYVCMEER